MVSSLECQQCLKVFEINDMIKVTCKEIRSGSQSRVEGRRKLEAASPVKVWGVEVQIGDGEHLWEGETQNPKRVPS